MGSPRITDVCVFARVVPDIYMYIVHDWIQEKYKYQGMHLNNVNSIIYVEQIQIEIQKKYEYQGVYLNNVSFSICNTNTDTKYKGV